MDELQLKMLLFFAVASLGGWLMLWAGISTRRDCSRREQSETRSVTGTITGYTVHERHVYRGGTTRYFTATIEYEVFGKVYSQAYENAIDPSKNPVGTQVGLLCSETDPTRFHLSSDPVFLYRGGKAIRVALIWILLSAALSVALAVFVGGGDLRSLFGFRG